MTQFQNGTVCARAIDDPRPLRVVVVGAGISGILATIRLRDAISPLELVVYEKNAEVGGTWFENHYPGLACGMSLGLDRCHGVFPSVANQLDRHSCPHLPALLRVESAVEQVLCSWIGDLGILEASCCKI